MAEKKEAEAPAKSGVKLILFNQSQNPYELRKGPNGEKRRFAVGTSIECLDQAEYDQLVKYRGVSTTQQVSPDLGRYVVQLEAEKKALQEEVAELKKTQKKG